jgi:phosphopantothenoylcysteine decarboxylase/phosphopantothenate--cysteine ligase
LKNERLKSRKRKDQLKGKKILVTAGPTLEKIDPVRFISNLSTGKMGYAIAETLAEKGAFVRLVSGPVSVTIDHPNIELIQIISALEMYDQSVRIFPDCDAAILSAAVADYSPVKQFNKKIKHKEDVLYIELKPTLDIAATLGQMKRTGQILVGFALESENEIRNAIKKMKKKNLDFIVLNSLRDPGAGFGTDTNRVTIIDRHNNIEEFELKPKKDVAVDIINKLEEYFENFS